MARLLPLLELEYQVFAYLPLAQLESFASDNYLGLLLIDDSFWQYVLAVQHPHLSLEPSFSAYRVVNMLRHFPQGVNTALYAAAKLGSKQLVDYCLAAGASDWDRGLTGAAAGGHKELIQFFADKGANSWDMALMEATTQANWPIVQYCLAHGARNYHWAYLAAEQYGHQQLMVYFVYLSQLTTS